VPFFAKHTDEQFEQVVKERTALEAQLNDLQGKLNAEAGRANSETAKANDLQEENDLLLAQLHQVQEELEKYYLKNKDLEQSLGEVTTSLRGARYLLVKSGFSPRARA
jgi:chaperonin cofactor prefoldin